MVKLKDKDNKGNPRQQQPTKQKANSRTQTSSISAAAATTTTTITTTTTTTQTNMAKGGEVFYRNGTSPDRVNDPKLLIMPGDAPKKPPSSAGKPIRPSSARSSSRRNTNRILCCCIAAAVVLFIGTTYTFSEPSTSTSSSTVEQVSVGPAFPANATAACLIMFDDNLSLVEWLAYHYHTMTLRHVIVLTDPRSTESPIPILQRWSDDTLLTWEFWDETRVFPSMKILQDLRDAGDLVQLHRNRQSYFYAQCMRELKLRNARQQSSVSSIDEWVILTDVDEYVTINPHTADPKHKLYRPRMAADNATISLYQPGTVLDFIRHERNPPTCLHMARRDMVSKESSLEEINAGVPHFLNATQLYTTRWRYQSHRVITGKCLVNLKALRYGALPLQSPRQGHVPLRHFQCPNWYPKYFYDMDNTPLVVHHYLGTSAQYFYRDDPRVDRTNAGFEKKQQYPTEVRDTVRSWLQGFVDQVGQERAAKLLYGAGTLGGGVASTRNSV